jgi:hypothetical protein
MDQQCIMISDTFKSPLLPAGFACLLPRVSFPFIRFIFFNLLFLCYPHSFLLSFLNIFLVFCGRRPKTTFPTIPPSLHGLWRTLKIEEVGFFRNNGTCVPYYTALNTRTLIFIFIIVKTQILQIEV